MEAFAYNSSTVTDLLEMLVKNHENLYWHMCCSYADGQGQTIMEITIYEGRHRRVKGLIAFNAETGKIKNYRYRGYKKQDCDNCDNIVDMLLDLVNFEKYQVLTMAS